MDLAGESLPRRLVAGLMTGTSADGIDAALVEVRGRGLQIQARVLFCTTDPFPADLRSEVLRCAQPRGAGVVDLAKLHARLGHAYAAAIRALAQRAQVPLARILCIGCHGQTVWHAPGETVPTTLQLGAAAVIAEQTGVSVVNDFRWRDLAAGGQGAPLVPLIDWLLLRSAHIDRVAVNLGGIVNVTILPAAIPPDGVHAFDVGPGNMVLDRLVQELTRGKERFDAGGRLAVQGRQLKPLLQHWAQHPFLQRPPPKSTGREDFGEHFFQESLALAAREGWSVLDVLCTATHFSALCLADALERFVDEKTFHPATSPSRELIVSGGGVHNGLLLRAIAERLPNYTLQHSDEFGLPVDAKEAVAFALLACLAVDGTAGNVPSATGAAGPRLLGSFTPGSTDNWKRLLRWVATR